MDVLIGLFANLIFVIILIVFNRNIIGASGYYFFAPLIMAFVFYIGFIDVIYLSVMMISLLLGWIVVSYLNHRFHYSLYPRYGMYLTMSISFFLLMLQGVEYIYEISLYGETSLKMLIVMFVLIAFVIVKIVNFGDNILSLNWIVHMSRFIVFTIIIYWGLTNDYIATMASDSRRFFVGMLLLVVLLSHYRGLQLKEIYRFRSLIAQELKRKIGFKV